MKFEPHTIESTAQGLDRATQALSTLRALLGQADALGAAGLREELGAVHEKAVAALLALAPHLPLLAELPDAHAHRSALAAWMGAHLERASRDDGRMAVGTIREALERAGLSATVGTLESICAASGVGVQDQGRSCSAVFLRWKAAP